MGQTVCEPAHPFKSLELECCSDAKFTGFVLGLIATIGADVRFLDVPGPVVRRKHEVHFLALKSHGDSDIHAIARMLGVLGVVADVGRLHAPENLFVLDCWRDGDAGAGGEYALHADRGVKTVVATVVASGACLFQMVFVVAVAQAGAKGQILQRGEGGLVVALEFELAAIQAGNNEIAVVAARIGSGVCAGALA